jgi:hypothetical protein
MVSFVINTYELLAKHPELQHRKLTLPQQAQAMADSGSISALLGTAIVMPIAFGAVQYQKRLNGEVVNDSFPGIELPPATVVSFERAKRIISTEIAGRDGEVNEFTGFSSWKINIRGVLVNEENPNEIPEQGIRDLRDLFDVAVALPMLCDMCEWLGIYEVVIDSFTFHDVAASVAQPFSMTLRSDYPFEFKIKKGL